MEDLMENLMGMAFTGQSVDNEYNELISAVQGTAADTAAEGEADVDNGGDNRDGDGDGEEAHTDHTSMSNRGRRAGGGRRTSHPAHDASLINPTDATTELERALSDESNLRRASASTSTSTSTSTTGSRGTSLSTTATACSRLRSLDDPRAIDALLAADADNLPPMPMGVGMGGYDSCDESVAESASTAEGTGTGTGETKDKAGGAHKAGLLGRFGSISLSMLTSAKQNLSTLVGCGAPCSATKKGAGGANGVDGQEPKDFNINFEDIEELSFLGSGSYGCVFKGVLHDQLVAVKKFKDKKHVGQEMTHLKMLDHPNVVRLLGACTQPPVFCLVMELCQRSMYDVLQETELGPAVVCNWAKQVACGLHYLHSLNIVHRDLKSPNILIGQDGKTLKISDFGTAREFGPKSTPQSFQGSLPWMAPEAIRSERCSQMVDVWSFGVVLWELLTGQEPYAGVDPYAIMFRVGTGELELPIPESAPLGFSLLLKLCWNQNPKHRPKMRSVLLHLQIVEDDSGFLEIPAKDYFATQRSWKKECSSQFSKMKLEHEASEASEADSDSSAGSDGEAPGRTRRAARAKVNGGAAAETRESDQLVKRREQELAHAADVRRLMEKRLNDASKLWAAVKEREREVHQRERALSHTHAHAHAHRKRGKSVSTAGHSHGVHGHHTHTGKVVHTLSSTKSKRPTARRKGHRRSRSRDLTFITQHQAPLLPAANPGPGSTTHPHGMQGTLVGSTASWEVAPPKDEHKAPAAKSDKARRSLERAVISEVMARLENLDQQNAA